MSVTIVTVPKWGLAMEEGRITAWHVSEGGDVTAGADLVDIETSKIANCVEAPVSGVLRRILADGDGMLPCGTAIGVIAPATASDAEIDAALADYSIAAAAETAAAGDAAPAYRDLPVGDGGLSLRAYEAGEGGEPVVFLHGFGGDARTWSLLQASIAGSRRTVAIDLPGHGGSTKHLADWSAAALARLVADALDGLGIGRCHLVAHSMGAAVARELVLLDEGRVASLTAFAPADLGLLDPAYVAAFRTARRRSQMADALAMLFADPAFVTRDMAEDLLRYRRIDGVEAALVGLDAAIFTGGGRARPAGGGAVVGAWREGLGHLGGGGPDRYPAAARKLAGCMRLEGRDWRGAHAIRRTARPGRCAGRGTYR